jgi:hypothetical protein
MTFISFHTAVSLEILIIGYKTTGGGRRGREKGEGKGEELRTQTNG